jgi:uncharacterized delta-60 repeat protein
VGIAGVRSLIIQNDLKIVAVGFSDNGINSRYFTLARYNTNGSLDNSFGTNGIVITPDSSASVAFASAIQKDGKIVVGGVTGVEIAIARYNVDGTLDTTFGQSGKVTMAIGTFAIANSLAIHRNGKIFVAGSSYTAGIKGFDIILIRLNSNGNPDTEFGTGGIAFNPAMDYEDASNSVIIQNEDKIVVGGYSETKSRYYNFALARYNNNGDIDQTFGVGGIVKTQVGNFRTSIINTIAQQNNGNIVAGGYSDNGSDYNAFCIARYTSSISTGINDPKTGAENNAAILEQNYPNPFDLSTKIKYELPISGYVTLKIYNLMGQEVKTLVNQNQGMGTYEVEFSSGKLSSGVYSYRLTIGDKAVARLMILSR